MLEYKGDGDSENLFKFSGMPHAYGMIPQTFEDPKHTDIVSITKIGESKKSIVEIGGDQDPLDIFILSDRELPMG